MIREYLYYLANNKMYSENTIRRYECVLSSFAKAMRGGRWSLITRQDVENYLSSLHTSANTKASALSAIRGLFSFACSHYGLAENPCRFISSPALPRLTPHIVGYEVINKAISSTEDKRMKLAIMLMSRCGLRVSEVLPLTVEDLSNEKLIVRGKGNKDRYIYIPSYIISLAQSIQGTGAIYASYTDRAFRYNIWVIFKALGYDVSPHMLRHSFASKLANDGMPLNHLQMLLGHESIKTTQIYLHADNQRVRESYYQYV